MNEETLSRLAGEWWIYQLKRGHRYNTDDVLVSWAALRAVPAPRRILEMCAGTGSVGLMTLLRCPAHTRLVSVERQAVSVGLMRRTLAHNGLTDRVTIRHGDLRHPESTADIDAPDLILANPPYLPPGSAVASPHPQRAAARLELHGSVFDVCRTAASHMNPESRLVMCFPAPDARAEAAVDAAGLVLRSRQDVVFREGHPPRLALFICGLGGERQDLEPITVRDSDGQFTNEYMDVRREMLIA